MSKQKFAIINHKGTPQSFFDKRTANTETRQDKIFIQEWGEMVSTTPYDDHFIYENPDKSHGSPSFMCTCGAMAVVVPPFGPNRTFVCHHHATFGFHTTSMVNKKDIEQGKTKIFRGRKWA
jgi:hypothetical protein